MALSDLSMSSSSSSNTSQSNNKSKPLVKPRTRFVEVAEGIKRLPYSPFPDRNTVLLFLRNHALSHQWDKCFNILRMVLKDPRLNHDCVFRYTLLILEHCQPLDRSFPKYFDMSVYPFGQKLLKLNLDRREVLLEMVMMLMRQGYLTRATELLEEYEDAKYFTAIDYEEDEENIVTDEVQISKQSIDCLLKAYSGYFHYLRWLGVLESTTGLHEKDLAEKAFYHLSTVISINYDPNLSMFLHCLLRIFNESEYECSDELHQLLTAYTKKNPDDLSAHIITKSFLDKRIITTDVTKTEYRQLRRCQKEIVRLSPADLWSRNIAMNRSSSKRRARRDSIEMLINFLDYKHNMQDREAWKSLVAKIELLKQNDYECFNQLCDDLKQRMNDYWKDVHFSPEKMSSKDSDSEVNHHKSNLLNLLTFS